MVRAGQKVHHQLDEGLFRFAGLAKGPSSFSWCKAGKIKFILKTVFAALGNPSFLPMPQVI